MTQPARYAVLWGGPEDGERVWLGTGDLPPRVGVHRTGDGALVPIRSRALLQGQPMVADHVTVYERATIDVQRAWLDLLPAALSWETADGAVYVWRELVTRWLAAST